MTTPGFFVLLTLSFLIGSWALAISAARDGSPDYERLRQKMVADQLSARGITNPAVLKAMGKIPRHELVPEKQRPYAYEDRPVPIGHGQTISQPYVVAFMTEQLEPEPGEKILEIGTGSGYQAAVLGELGARVYSIEIVGELARQAAGDLKRLGYTNVFTRAGDGYQGWPEFAPFDAIIVTCAPDKIPRALKEQLKNGGRMIIPVGSSWTGQQLVLLRKKDDVFQEKSVLPVQFVPMTGGRGDGGAEDGGR